MSNKNQLRYFNIFVILSFILLLFQIKDTTTASEISTIFEQETGISNHSEDFITLQIVSSRRRVTVLVDSKKVLDLQSKSYNRSDSSNNGLHLVAINPRSGTTVMKRRFLTQLFGESIGVPVILKTLTNGEIVVLAVKYDSSLNLSKSVRRLLRALGAYYVPFTRYRSYFIWVFVSGGKTMVESVINDDPTSVGDHYASPIHVHLSIPTDTKTSCWQESTHQKTVQRTKFCNTYGGYGDLCSCASPLQLNFQTPEFENNAIRNEPILIVANKRPQSLFKCLLTILNQPGGHKSNIFVVVDGYHQEVNDLLQLLEIPYVINMDRRTGYIAPGAKIAQTYKFALSKTLEVFPEAKFVIVIEEDLLLAPDFISFLNQTSSVLASDNSLCCINGWNDLSAMHTGGDPHMVMRQETQPAYGWMIERRLFEEVRDIWPLPRTHFDWDVWFRGPLGRSSRECLVPEVSRSFHLGSSGVHIKGQFTYSQFTGHLSTGKQLLPLHNLDRLYQEKYEENLFDLLTSDQVHFLNTTLHPCSPYFIPRNYEKTIVIFFDMSSGLDDYAWHRVSSCLGLFNMDTRNSHHGLFTFYFYNTKVLGIGYPYSDYSFVKPPFITPVSEIKTTWDTKHLSGLTAMNRLRFRVPQMEQRMPFELPMDKAVPIPYFIYPSPNANSTN